jgi:hypothetical protein
MEVLESRQLLSIAPALSATAEARSDATVNLHVNAPGTLLIPGNQPRDLIVDNTHQQLLVVEPTQLLRYSLSNHQLQDTILLGSDVTGGDITSDGHYLYLAERGSHAIYKVDLEAATATFLVVSDYLGTPIDIAVSGSTAIVSQAYGVLGDNMRRVNIADDTVDNLWLRDIGPVGFQYFAVLARSADYSYVALTSTDGDCSFVDNWVTGKHVGGGYGQVKSLAVSRDGALHAVSTGDRITIVDRDFQTVQTLFNSASVAFDPAQDLLYVADTSSDKLITYDIHTWAPVSEHAIGEDLHDIDPFGAGVMTVDGNGGVYLATASGVRVFNGEGVSSSFGQTVTFRADVSSADASGPAPGGVVTFIDATTGDPLGQGTLVSGQAALTRNDIPAGTYSIIASYSGDLSFNDAASSNLTFEVTRASSSVSFAPTGASSGRITVSGPGSVPDSGTVNVLNSGSIIATAIVHAGIADVDIPLNLGPQELTVNYLGNQNFRPSTTTTIFVVKRQTTTTITTPPTTIQYGKNVHLEANVVFKDDPSFLVGTGTLTFTDNDGLNDTVNVFNGIAIYNNSSFSPGLHTITAQYNGNQFNQFFPSTSAPVNITIKILPSETNVKLSVSSTYMLTTQHVTLRAAVSATNHLDPQGSVIFRDGKHAIATGFVVNGLATASVTLRAGTHSITAAYTGATYFKPSTSKSASIVVFKPVIIDLMIVYTPAALTSTGSVDDMQDLLDESVSGANQAFLNSHIPLVLNLVHSDEINYHESGKFETDLKRLTNRKDGYMDSVHTMRNQYHADLVSLFESDGDFGGLGWELRDTHDPDNASFGFSLVLSSQASSPYYTLAHELGHNLGATHDAEHREGKGATDFSNGWRFRGKDGRLYHDIMSYDPGNTIPYFSNPRIKYQGVPTGDPDTADSARTITLTAPFVAAYRR